MEGYEDFGKGLLGLVLFILYQILSAKKKKKVPPPIAISEEPHDELPPIPLAKAIPQLESKKAWTLKENPIYIPKRKSTDILKQAKGRRDLFVLSEILRRPQL